MRGLIQHQKALSGRESVAGDTASTCVIRRKRNDCSLRLAQSLSPSLFKLFFSVFVVTAFECFSTSCFGRPTLSDVPCDASSALNFRRLKPFHFCTALLELIPFTTTRLQQSHPPTPDVQNLQESLNTAIHLLCAMLTR